LRIYKSALTAFENFRKDFPDSKFNEEVSFLKIETQFDFAEKSLYRKQKERYSSVKVFYESFIDTYPSSEFLEIAEKYYAISIDKLSKFADSIVKKTSDKKSESDK
jgi:outer membrane protein assembly factor BamD